MTVAERDGAVLRRAREEDLAAVDALTVAGYTAIQESFVAMLGEDLYETVHADPEQPWTTPTSRRAAPTRRSASTGPSRPSISGSGSSGASR